MTKLNMKTHGGKRKGAGRPKGSATKEPTKVIRVPVSKLEAIKTLLGDRQS